jgi:hypothetical protein
MSTHAIKTELMAALAELRPEQKWTKRVTVTDLCSFAIASIPAESDDPRCLRALELAHVLYDNERR